jgi:hypothetical protein
MDRKLTLFLLLVTPVSAQTPTRPEVTKALVCDRGSSCQYGYISGRKYETLASDKVAIVATLEIVGKYVRMDVFVLNESENSVDVLPSNFVLTEIAPKQKALKYVDGDKLIQSAERRLVWGNALTAMSGSMARQQATTTTNSTGTVTVNSIGAPPVMGTYSGTSTSTTSTPDYAAQAQAAQTIQARNEAFASFSSFASRTTLRANSVPPAQSVRGYLLFERDKKAKSIMLSGIVGNTIYQFPFDLTVQ